jgi:hypothetical protein
VLFVLYTVCKLVYLNNFVIALVSLPTYVNVAHFCFWVESDVVFVVFLFLYDSICGVYLLLCSIVFVIMCLFSVDMG